ncbi:MAG: SpoIIE family protein phosphatase [Candidatus Nitrohelix vancouverensis]|uniref:SpoIIE family protein phosphatase n=1 Tax=Candidatus Nitrohelix vancouverensis TaxID=2705534 RepID=A0A7T0C546_9BACT|nr:MAG: SpoIIE family protein phosphatase [Candidatus Nitrohelix vancouverensis]
MDINPYTQSPWCILLADPANKGLDRTCAALKSGYTMLIAEDGPQTVETYLSKRPDIIVMSADAPALDGFQVCRKIKDISGRRFTPIILVSEQTDISSLQQGFQSGAEDYLRKPFEPEELIIRIQSALRTKKLYVELMKAYEVIDRERDILANIQKNFFSEAPPQIPGYQFFTKYQPSSKAGGDYYDFIQIDQERLGIMTADVSGHGIPAAVVMSMKRILLRAFLSDQASPAETLETLNSVLFKHLKSGHFITAFYGVLNTKTRVMKYACAGHCPPFLLDCNSGELTELKNQKGIPLMILPDNPMDEVETQLPPNSKLVLYTDGLIEAQNRQGEQWGRQRLADEISRLGAEQNLDAFGEQILASVDQFMGGNAFSDDYTLVALQID